MFSHQRPSASSLNSLPWIPDLFRVFSRLTNAGAVIKEKAAPEGRLVNYFRFLGDAGGARPNALR